MWQSFWIPLWTLTSLFCSMSSVDSWYLLKEITKHASLLYLYIFKNNFEEARERSLTSLLYESCGIMKLMKAYLEGNLTQTFC